MKEKSIDSINVVPFIDIMLVLLTIVLATATFIKTGAIPVELPVVSHSEGAIESVIIDISEDGIFYFDTTPRALPEIREILLKTSRSAPITVRADRRAAIQPFAELMSLLKECGFEKIDLQTEVSG
ncbi:MAG: biopolymer transporter ExbD [Deferribacteraceae bacterium]|nr:biopolymer transporter ExbD [Deferribacteraceae bacterium]